jgi:hypothetical protein
MATLPPFLICEGELDVKVLDAIIGQNLQRNVRIRAAGGKEGLGSVCSYIKINYSTNADSINAYSIEDRDYRLQNEVEALWTKRGGTKFIWRRHQVENYLLDPRVVAKAFESFRGTLSTWPAGMPQTADEIDKILQQLAEPMIEHHAGWVTYWHLIEKKRGTADHRFKWPDPPLKPHAGARYPGRQEWLDHLCQECSRVKGDCEVFAQSPEFEAAAVTALYDQVLSEAKQPGFFSGGQYLITMAGKELMGALREFIDQAGVTISLADLETELINALEGLYGPGFFDPDDFSELASRLV